MTPSLRRRAVRGLLVSAGLSAATLLSACGSGGASSGSLDASDTFDATSRIPLPTPPEASREASDFLSLCGSAAPSSDDGRTVAILKARAMQNDCSKAFTVLSRLTELDLQNERLVSVAPLVGLTELRHLYLGNNAIRDLSSLSRLSGLLTLWVANNAVDIASLPVLPKLEDLDLSGNRLVSLGKLAAKVPALRFLYARQNGLTHLRDLEGLARIEKIEVSDNAIDDLAPLSRLRTLRILEFTLNRVSDLAPVAKLPMLNVIIGGKNRVASLAPLEGNRTVAVLALWGNAITDLSPLGAASSLFMLNVGHNAIRSLAPVAGLTKLTDLDVRANPLDRAACPIDARSPGVAAACRALP
jgi:internalin A